MLCKSLDEAITDYRADQSKSKSCEGLQKKRKLAEIIIERKNRLAIGSYDLLDKHIRLIDDELNALDEAIGESDVGASLSSEAQLEPVPFVTTTANEPLYCSCRRTAFGQMIACDNEDCLIEWFHFSCVGLTKLPRKLWYCPDCALKMKQQKS